MCLLLGAAQSSLLLIKHVFSWSLATQLSVLDLPETLALMAPHKASVAPLPALRQSHIIAELAVCDLASLPWRIC